MVRQLQANDAVTCIFTDMSRNTNLSHITSGFMYFSPSQNLVRVDEAYDGSLAASIFDYKNVTQDGRVQNTLYSYTDSLTTPDVWNGYVVSDFPLFKTDMLVEKGAVFGGLVERDLLKGKVAAVSTQANLLVFIALTFDG